jgi:exo-beta-1,3-glucanase (GH17 family)
MKTSYVLRLMGLLLIPSTVFSGQVSDAFKKDLLSLKWVAYAPSTPGPVTAENLEPEKRDVQVQTIRDDLKVLAKARFEGIVTYGCGGALREVPRLAREAGISHVILGVWDPTNVLEMDTALSLAREVDGYCIGNEGFVPGQKGRYGLGELKQAMERLRAATDKPVTTSEEMDDYLNESALFELGDWVFPNVHPYWANKLEARRAIEWTEARNAELAARAGGRLVMLKEVGFPTAGDETRVSEQLQLDYYAGLARTAVKFVYFEAFDQVWKRHKEVEPHWGLFHSPDRSPKLAAQVLFGVPAVAPPQPSNVTPTLAFTRPTTSQKEAVCKLTTSGGEIEVSGTSLGIHGSGRVLVLFVNPQHSSARGWFVQFGLNGIHMLRPDGTWRGIAQLGNQKSAPEGGDPISLAVMALPQKEADEILAKARKTPDEPLSSLPQIANAPSDTAEDVVVRIKK